MRRVLGFILLAALVVPAGLRAQDHSEQIAFLDMLVGTFEYEHIEGGGECEKVGLYNVNCVSRWTTTAGVEREAIWITRFNPETESFVGYRFYENGYADSGHGWVDGLRRLWIHKNPVERQGAGRWGKRSDLDGL